MKRKFYSFPVENVQETKLQMLNWANRFNICCFLDNQHYDLPHHSVECLVGAGVLNVFEPVVEFFTGLSSFIANSNDWIFGHFNYDCKNNIEELTSANPDHIGFPNAFLFVPEVVLQLSASSLLIGTINEDAAVIYKEIVEQIEVDTALSQVLLKSRIQYNDYISIIHQLKEHIKRGDCYEINFCQEFYNEKVDVDFIQVYKNLRKVSPNPFSAYYKIGEKHLACASPERYIKKTGSRIISQPIKGTAARNFSDPKLDELNKEMLRQTQKEVSENVMIVDLVRNDLSKVCKEGSVKVEELMKVYTFPNVHQMISTIAGTLPENIGLAEVLKATFPMGSMTGAPKIRVMQLIEEFEKTKRGIYSGAVGYINPAKDFDFNVVIRSIMYNQQNQYMSYQVGGGITIESDPQKEYEECQLKADAILQVLSSK